MRKLEALTILGINPDSEYDIPQITKAYRIASLKHHPDKNENSNESTCKFQEINEAYHYLINTLPDESSYNTDYTKMTSYQDIFIFFIRSIFVKNGISTVNSDCIETALIDIITSNYDKLLKTLDKQTAITVYEFMHEYADILHLPPETLERMLGIVSDKMKSDNVIILNPTLSDALNKKIYELEYNGKRFTVPLWHNETYYTLSDSSELIVRCNICDIPDYMYIDENNHIILSIRTSIQKILDAASISVSVPVSETETINLTVPAHELRVTKTPQLYNCRDSVGLPKINTRNLLDSSATAGISIQIELY
jgi:hypothetical protein